MELYAEQMRFYGLAWHLLHPNRAVTLGLCFLREGKTELFSGQGFRISKRFYSPADLQFLSHVWFRIWHVSVR